MLRTPQADTPDPIEDTESESAAPAAPNFDTPPRLIAELVTDPAFPKSALGLHVDIGGITGVIAEIVGPSVKLRTPEGALKSYNAYTLCKLHAPAPRPEPTPEPPPPAAVARTSADEDSEEEEPGRNVIEQPDFKLPLKPVSDWVGRADFPQCTFGAHVDFGGYSGVVVEIVRQSLKVLSVEGDYRSYNAAVLRKLHGGR